MFYLIDDKDGVNFPNDYMLVNTKLLKMLEVTIEKNAKNIEMAFCFSSKSSENDVFTIDKDGRFNTNQIMENLSRVTAQKYDNALIVLQDTQNINQLKNHQFYLHKFSNILINLDNICLVYTNVENENIIVTLQKTISIQQTPQQVFDMIQSKVIQ